MSKIKTSKIVHILKDRRNIPPVIIPKPVKKKTEPSEFDRILKTKMDEIRQYILENDPVKEVVNFNGIVIEIEWKKGEIRQYINSIWKNFMQYDYGYIRNTTSRDDENLDICLYAKKGQHDWVGVLKQLDSKTGKFDEWKYFLGFPNLETARDYYINTMQKNMYGGIKAIPFEYFKEKIVRNNYEK